MTGTHALGPFSSPADREQHNMKLILIVRTISQHLIRTSKHPTLNMSGFKSERDPGFDLGKYVAQRVRVKFGGGREVEGLLKGFDKLDNLVLDDCVEYLRGACLLFYGLLFVCILLLCCMRACTCVSMCVYVCVLHSIVASEGQWERLFPSATACVSSS